MKDEMVVVWYSNGAGWYPSNLMSKYQAEFLAADYQSMGYTTRIIPRPRITKSDMCDEEMELAN